MARSRLRCAAAAAAALLAMQAHAESAEETFDVFEASTAVESAPYDGRWLPTLTVGIGVTLSPQSATGRAEGFPPEPAVVTIGRSRLSVAPNFLVLAGIETLELAEGVRLFASGGVVPTIAFEIDIAKEGDPRGFSYPQQRDDGDPYPEGAIDGTGTRTTAQIRPLAFAANLGVSYSTRIGDHQVDFRPSVGFYHHTVRAEGVRLRAIKPEVAEPFVREISLYDELEQSFPAIGPAIEVGVDLGRKGSFKPSLFFDASFYRVLGDRTIELSHSGTDSFGTTSADWTMTVEPWAYRLGLGLRVAWIGK